MSKKRKFIVPLKDRKKQNKKAEIEKKNYALNTRTCTIEPVINSVPIKKNEPLKQSVGSESLI